MILVLYILIEIDTIFYKLGSCLTLLKQLLIYIYIYRVGGDQVVCSE